MPVRPRSLRTLLSSRCFRKPLRDDAYHTIFEAIFSAVRTDKPYYLRQTAQRTKDAAARRLTACANVLRIAVENGTSAITSRTAAAVIDHVIDTLPDAEGGYFPPLRVDYLKCLRAMLESAPLVEHLRRKQWQSLVDFLLEGINDGSGEDALGTSASTRRSENDHSKNSLHLSVRSSQFSSARSQGSESNNSSADLVPSLSLLTAATNTPLMTRAGAIMSCMTNFLDHATASQHDALAAFNNVLSSTVTEDLSLARSAVFDLLPVMRRLWSTKSAPVKEQMMITLILGKDVLASHEFARNTEEDRLSLINLYDAIVLEYQRRNDRDVLNIDDVRFWTTSESQPVGLNGIVPIVESGRSLANWTIVSLMAALATIIDGFRPIGETAQLSNGTPKKRRKFGNRVDELLDQVLTDTGIGRARALHVIVFLLDESDDFPERVADHFLQLASYILDDDPASSSWAMLLFAQ